MICGRLAISPTLISVADMKPICVLRRMCERLSMSTVIKSKWPSRLRSVKSMPIENWLVRRKAMGLVNVKLPLPSLIQNRSAQAKSEHTYKSGSHGNGPAVVIAETALGISHRDEPTPAVVDVQLIRQMMRLHDQFP